MAKEPTDSVQLLTDKVQARRDKRNAYMRNYYANHKQAVDDNHKRYIARNAGTVKAYFSKKVHCDVCNIEVVWTYKKEHDTTKRHLAKLAKLIVNDHAPVGAI